MRAFSHCGEDVGEVGSVGAVGEVGEVVVDPGNCMPRPLPVDWVPELPKLVPVPVALVVLLMLFMPPIMAAAAFI